MRIESAADPPGSSLALSVLGIGLVMMSYYLAARGIFYDRVSLPIKIVGTVFFIAAEASYITGCMRIWIMIAASMLPWRRSE